MYKDEWTGYRLTDATSRSRKIWNWFTYIVYGAILFASLTAMMIAFMVSQAYSHNTQIITCTNNILYTQAVKVAEDVVDYRLSAVYEYYDTNNDGERDIVAVSHITSLDGPQDDPKVTHHRYPYYYLVDVDYDGYPDKTYVDRYGVGNCDDIYFYEDVRTFGDTPRFDSQTEGQM